MKLWQAFKIAFAMYSKIPMKGADWSKENMKYAICFFPMIGGVIGIVYYIVFSFLQQCGAGTLLTASILVCLPIFITGGIHVDGFLDTMDARSSYAERERKLEILKDSHTGAFAIIGGSVYFLLNLGFASEISSDFVIVVAIGFIYSRAFSGLAMVTLKGARKEGMLASFSNGAEKKAVRLVMGLYLLLAMAGMVWANPVIGAACVLTGWCVFSYYKQMSYKEFGGITGDLAGYFLQICELSILMVAVIMGYISGIIL